MLAAQAFRWRDLGDSRESESLSVGISHSQPWDPPYPRRGCWRLVPGPHGLFHHPLGAWQGEILQLSRQKNCLGGRPNYCGDPVDGMKSLEAGLVEPRGYPGRWIDFDYGPVMGQISETQEIQVLLAALDAGRSHSWPGRKARQGGMTVDDSEVSRKGS